MISNFTSLLHSIRGHLSRDTIPESDLEKLLDISALFFVRVPLYLIYVLSSVSCKNRSQGYHLAPTTVAGGTRSIGTSYQLSSPKKEQTAFSWCARAARAQTDRPWMAIEWRGAFWHGKNARHALWKLYDLQVWINLIHRFYWLIDNSAELFRRTRIPAFLALAAEAAKTTVASAQI